MIYPSSMEAFNAYRFWHSSSCSSVLTSWVKLSKKSFREAEHIVLDICRLDTLNSWIESLWYFLKKSIIDVSKKKGIILVILTVVWRLQIFVKMKCSQLKVYMIISKNYEVKRNKLTCSVIFVLAFWLEHNRCML